VTLKISYYGELESFPALGLSSSLLKTLNILMF
jgi:hypothetical protein